MIGLSRDIPTSNHTISSTAGPNWKQIPLGIRKTTQQKHDWCRIKTLALFQARQGLVQAISETNK